MAQRSPMTFKYGQMIPPGLDAPRQGEVRLAVDRVIVHPTSEETAAMLERRSPNAQQPAPTPDPCDQLEVVWYGAAKAVIGTPRMSDDVEPTTYIFPITTLQAQIQHYFKDMTSRQGGLRLVLRRSKQRSQTDPAAGVVGVAAIHLDAIDPARPISGWFNILDGAERRCIGRIRVGVSITFFGPDKSTSTPQTTREPVSSSILASPAKSRDTDEAGANRSPAHHGPKKPSKEIEAVIDRKEHSGDVDHDSKPAVASGANREKELEKEEHRGQQAAKAESVQSIINKAMRLRDKMTNSAGVPSSNTTMPSWVDKLTARSGQETAGDKQPPTFRLCDPLPISSVSLSDTSSDDDDDEVWTTQYSRSGSAQVGEVDSRPAVRSMVPGVSVLITNFSTNCRVGNVYFRLKPSMDVMLRAASHTDDGWKCGHDRRCVLPVTSLTSTSKLVVEAYTSEDAFLGLGVVPLGDHAQLLTFHDPIKGVDCAVASVATSTDDHDGGFQRDLRQVAAPMDDARPTTPAAVTETRLPARGTAATHRGELINRIPDDTAATAAPPTQRAATPHQQSNHNLVAARPTSTSNMSGLLRVQVNRAMHLPMVAFAENVDMQVAPNVFVAVVFYDAHGVALDSLHTPITNSCNPKFGIDVSRMGTYVYDVTRATFTVFHWDGATTDFNTFVAPQDDDRASPLGSLTIAASKANQTLEAYIKNRTRGSNGIDGWYHIQADSSLLGTNTKGSIGQLHVGIDIR